MNIYKNLVILALFAITNSALAVSCLPDKISAHGNMYWLNKSAGGKTIYFVKNTSNSEILLDHPDKRGAKAGWSSNLHPHNWSAILVSRQNFALSCAKTHGEKIKPVGCNKVIEVCKSNITGIRQSGDFWLVEDKSWGEMVVGVQARLKKE